MTLEEVKALSDDELRIRVAKLLGWEVHTWKGLPSLAEDPTEKQWIRRRVLLRESELPNYPRDLNACHEMEMTLTKEQFQDYTHRLFIRFHIEENGKTADYPPDRTVMCATARQRCEAFVLTMEGVKP